MSWIVVISTLAIGAGTVTSGPAPSVNVSSVVVDSEQMCASIASDFTTTYEVKGVLIKSKGRCYGDGVPVSSVAPMPVPAPLPGRALEPRLDRQRYATDLPPIPFGHPADPRTVDGCYDPRTGADYCAQKCGAECMGQ